MFDPNAWYADHFDPLKLTLDARNPRIEVPEDAEQRDVRLQLLKHEDVSDLAKDIANFGGLLPGDRVIVTKEAGSFVVLEGNRRVAACQLILDDSLVPEEYKIRFRRMVTSDLKDSVRALQADVAPTREDAEPILTRFHSQRAKKEWKPVAKMRRDFRLYNDGVPIDEIASRFGASSSEVKRRIKGYRMLRQSMNLQWTDDERDCLDDEDLSVNPYIRFFQLKRTKEILGESFDSLGNIVSTLPDELWKRILRHITYQFLISQFADGGPYATTRTTPDAMLKPFMDELDAWQRQKDDDPTSEDRKKNEHGKQDDAGKQKNENDRRKSTGGPSPAPFFGDLTWTISDDRRLQCLAQDLKRINHKHTPYAAAMVLRATLEWCIRYHLRKTNQESALKHKDLQSLDGLLRAASNPQKVTFSEERVPAILKQFNNETEYKKMLDWAIHNEFADLTGDMLENIAAHVRPVITHILSGKS